MTEAVENDVHKHDQRSSDARADAKPLLVVEGVERTFQVGGQPLHVLKGFIWNFKPRQLVMLRGRSGSGKTTLLNMIGGLDHRPRTYFFPRPALP